MNTRKSFTAQAVREGPELLEGIQEGLGSVQPSPMSLTAGGTCMARDEYNAVTGHHAHLLFAAVPQHKCGITARVLGEPNKLIENPAAFLLPHPLKPGTQLPDDCMTFAHCEPHGKQPPAR